MRMGYRELKHLAVETQSGAMLGHVHDLVLDTEGQLVAQYEVKSSLLSAKVYLISRDQVARFEEHKMIVVDGITPTELGSRKKKVMKVAPEPMAMRKET